jgi:hypothetical protein
LKEEKIREPFAVKVWFKKGERSEKLKFAVRISGFITFYR